MLQCKGGVFPSASYLGGAFISALCLGSMGMLVSNLSNSTIIGYMATIGYLIFNHDDHGRIHEELLLDVDDKQQLQ